MIISKLYSSGATLNNPKISIPLRHFTMIRTINIDEMLRLDAAIPLVDVRTPAEFEHGHMPGASNLPIFSNEQRVQVGTTYKQVGREAAILLGFDLTGAKWSGFVKEALEMAPDKKICLHCWRGGMRSGAMAWALNLYGFEVYLLSGGYKAYRHWVYRQFEKERKILVLGGMTGSGKTMVLRKLREMAVQVLDLEGLARHQGSTYGSMNRLVQPSQEQFENDLAACLEQLDPEKWTWVEDESFTIGQRAIPRGLWLKMQAAALVELEVGQSDRVARLVAEYGPLDKDFLEASTWRIRKRLGLEQTALAIQAIHEDRMADFIRIALVYYDKTYRKSQASVTRNQHLTLRASDPDPCKIAQQLQVFIAHHF